MSIVRPTFSRECNGRELPTEVQKIFSKLAPQVRLLPSHNNPNTNQMDTQQKARKLFWYSILPNSRPQWLRKIEDYLDKHHKGVEVSSEDVYDYLRRLSTEINNYLHNLNPPPRAKVWTRIIQGEPCALHVYRGYRPILLITL